jgi:hypothetical protein
MKYFDLFILGIFFTGIFSILLFGNGSHLIAVYTIVMLSMLLLYLALKVLGSQQGTKRRH